MSEKTFDKEKLYEGVIVAQNNDVCFIRVENHSQVFGSKDVFLHISKLKNRRGLQIEPQMKVKFKADMKERGPAAVSAELVENEGVSAEWNHGKKRTKNQSNNTKKKKSEITDFLNGYICEACTSKSGETIYFVSEENNRKNQFFLHPSKLPSTDKYFGLEVGTRLMFKEGVQRGKSREVGECIILNRVYKLKNLIQKLETSIREKKKESELVGMLRSVHAWQFLGDQLRNNADMIAMIEMQNEIMSLCKASDSLIKDAFGAFLKGDMLDPHSGPLKDYMLKMLVNKDQYSVHRLEILEYFRNISQYVPSNISRVIRLLKYWISDDDPLVTSLYKMLKNLGRFLLHETGETDVVLMDYQEVPLIPTLPEIRALQSMEFQKHLLPVLTSTPYESEDQYMDTYFKLQRAEGYSALCKAIREFNEGKLDHRDMNVYKNVSLAGLTVNYGRISLALKLRSVKEVKDLSASRYLMTGNLLCLTFNGDFSDPVWAKVSIRHKDTLKNESVVWVELTSEHNRNATTFDVILKLLSKDRMVLMAEAPTYYPSFGPVLKALQQYDISELSIKDQIVRCEKTAVRPEYLENSFVNLDQLLRSGVRMISRMVAECNTDLIVKYDEERETEDRFVSVENLIQMIFRSKKLDGSQKKAVKHALTNRVAIIQGPPGTGKSFIGTKITEILLNLETPSSTPILVITYKNHALDEFLTGLVKNGICEVNDICRVGGRSKEPMLEDCQLMRIMSRAKSHDAHELRDNIYDVNQHIKEVEEELKNGIAEFNTDLGLRLEDIVDGLEDDKLTKFLTNNHNDVKMGRMIQDAIFNKQTTIKDICKGHMNSDKLCGEIFKRFGAIFNYWKPKGSDFRDFKTNIESLREYLTSERTRLSEQTSRSAVSRYDQSTDEEEDDDDDEDDEEFNRDAEEWNNERLELLKVSGGGINKNEVPIITHFNMNDPNMIVRLSDFPDSCPLEEHLLSSNLVGMSSQEKIKYLYARLYQLQNNSRELISSLMSKLEKLTDMKDELESLFRAKVLKSKKVVGMTITGASINNRLVKLLSPEIVVVEEAAEILEPQLLVALPKDLKHLIMIGDHKQLPPQVNTYQLKKKLNFDCSMMQRLIQNDVAFVQLEYQNRMRPELAELLDDVYPRLLSNEARVLAIKLPNVLSCSSYFWSHDHIEASKRSKSNVAEAKMVVSLAMLLVTYGHSPKEITILSAYLGQSGEIKKEIDSYKKSSTLLSDDNSFGVSTIDNYQGDENSIVIVSLVRGNTTGTVGFLKDLPRRCVAQSRAKSCVIFVGNENTVNQARCWKTLLDQVRVKSSSLTLNCPEHNSTKTIQSNRDAQLLLSKPEALCSKPCRGIFPCKISDHFCRKPCQPPHQHSRCLAKVSYQFSDCLHDTVKKCHQDEKELRCMQMISFNFEDCGHPETRVCYMGIKQEKILKCKFPCASMMSCKKHKCKKTCGDSHVHTGCKGLVPTQLACGHIANKICCMDDREVICHHMVVKKLANCQHSRKIECCKSITDYACQEIIKSKLKCGHEGKHKCSEPKETVICDHPCAREHSSCKHLCTRKCGEKCADCKVCLDIFEEKKKAAVKEWKDRADMIAKELRRKADTPCSVEVTDQSEFDSKKDLVIKYVQPSHNWFPDIYKIERVINRKLEKEFYQVRSELFDPQRPEDLKFHGTGDEGVQGICFGDGFRLPDINKNNMFGQGVYLASNSSKSAQELYTKGSCKLLLCRVLLGKSFPATSPMNHLTPKEMKKKGYDSLYAKPPIGGLKNDEFVVYDKRQALPAYIIHFRSLSYDITKCKLPTRSLGVFKKTKVYPKRTFDNSNPYEMHYIIAEGRFRRLQSGTSYRIESIDIVENAELEQKFRNKQAEFKQKGIGHNPVFGFHGTSAQNIDSILKKNFDLAYFKTGVYGFGIYFSEQPEVSIGSYVRGCNSVILCEILLGVPGVNCKEVRKDGDGRCWAIVIGETNGIRDNSTMDQIMPRYVINYN